MAEAFKLTKAYIQHVFAPLEDINDVEGRKSFFSETADQNITWKVAGSAHSLAGTRHSLEAHEEATFHRLSKRLSTPIRITITAVIVNAEPSEDGWWASIELRGEANKTSGGVYSNENVWLTRWNDKGKIVEIRSWFDFVLTEQLLSQES
ncbi:hypothetical protein V501_00817 [Pseudogymnoascus sp. VKM F-4519 (FW-2642)]|nr:hypothetical protein V501_00817 [Pseudogymnoascus sp. VKM F-4519 (FW-2642)]